MDKVLKQIMEQMDCTEKEAKIILDNILDTNNLVQRAIKISLKNEYGFINNK